MSSLVRNMIGRCPRCRKGCVFSGLLAMRGHCAECSLPFDVREQGDGPAFFGIVVVGTLTVICAAGVEIVYQPPYWVHIVTWPLFILVTSFISLRFAKSALLDIQYHLRPQDFLSSPPPSGNQEPSP